MKPESKKLWKELGVVNKKEHIKAKTEALKNKKHPKVKEIENSYEGKKDREHAENMNKRFGTFEERIKNWK